MKLGLILSAFQNLEKHVSEETVHFQEKSGYLPAILSLEVVTSQERSRQERLLVASFSQALEPGTMDFAATKFFGGTKQKAKNCTKGWACGYTCLSKKVKNCKKGLDGQAKTLAEFLEKQKPASKSKPAKKKASPTAMPEGHSVTVNPRINPNSIDEALDSIPTEGAKERVALLRKFAKNASVQAVFYDKGQVESQAKTLAQGLKYKYYTTTPGYEDSLGGIPPGIKKGSQEYEDFLIEASIKPYGSSYGYTAGNLKHVVVMTDSSEGWATGGANFKPSTEELGSVVEKAILSTQKYSMSRNTDHSDTQNLITYIHEMGHQVHFRSGIPDPPKNVRNLTQYSQKNKMEWFAEHFAAWMLDAKAYSQFDPVGAKFIESTVKKTSKKK